MLQLRYFIFAALLLAIQQSYAQTPGVFQYGPTCETATTNCFGAGTPLSADLPTGGSTTGSLNCLALTPNPMWSVFVGPADGDTMRLQVFGSNDQDLDFLLFGPFASAAAAVAACPAADLPVLDCGFNSSTVEVVRVPAAPVGSYFKLMVTNFADSAGGLFVVPSRATDCTPAPAACTLPVANQPGGLSACIGGPVVTYTTTPSYTGPAYVPATLRTAYLLADADTDEVLAVQTTVDLPALGPGAYTLYPYVFAAADSAQAYTYPPGLAVADLETALANGMPYCATVGTGRPGLLTSCAGGNIDCAALVPCPFAANCPPADALAGAPVYCSPNGFAVAGSTVGATPDGPAPPAFCDFDLDNNQWFAFVAYGAEAVLDILPAACDTPEGMQVIVYPLRCATGGFGVPLACESPGVTQLISISLTELLPGNTYVVMIDGFSGAGCAYVANLFYNDTAILPLAYQIEGPATYCPGTEDDFALDCATAGACPEGLTTTEWTLTGGGELAITEAFTAQVAWPTDLPADAAPVLTWRGVTTCGEELVYTRALTPELTLPADTLVALCAGEVLSLPFDNLPSDTYGYLWQTAAGDTLSAGSTVPSPVTGNYFLTVNNLTTTCSQTVQVAVAISDVELNAPPSVQLSCPPDTLLLAPTLTGTHAGQLTFTAVGPGGNIPLPDPVNGTLRVAGPGTYTARVVDTLSGCEALATTEVLPWNGGVQPVYEVQGNSTPQSGDTVTYTLTADAPLDTISWALDGAANSYFTGPKNQSTVRLVALSGPATSVQLVARVVFAGCPAPRFATRTVAVEATNATTSPGLPAGPTLGPNPTADAIHLRWPAPPGSVRYVLHDARGRRVLARESAASSFSISLAALPPAVYWLTAETATGSWMQRVVRR